MTTAKQVDFLLAGYRHPTTNRPLAGGKVETFLDGTSTLSALWTDANKGGVATNPVVLDSSGKAEVYGDNIYKFRIYDWLGIFIEEITGLEYESVLKTKNEFDTIADLRLVSGTVANETATVLGYNAVGDGGGGPPRYWSEGQPPGTYVDNGGSIIVPTGGDGSAAWLCDAVLNAKEWGAVGDGLTVDSSAINNIIQTGLPAYFPAGIYICDQTINTADINIKLYGDTEEVSEIRFVNSGDGIIVTNTSEYKVFINNIRITTTQIDPGTCLTLDYSNFAVAPIERNTSYATLRDIHISGTDFQANGWSRGIVMDECQQPVLEHVYVIGRRDDTSSGAGQWWPGMDRGISFLSTKDKSPTDPYFLDVHIRYAESGFYSQGVMEGLRFDNCMVVACGYGINDDRREIVGPDTSDPWLSVAECHFNTGIRGIKSTYCYQGFITNSLFYQFSLVDDAYIGIDLDFGNDWKISSNHINGNSASVNDTIGIKLSRNNQSLVNDNVCVSIDKPVVLDALLGGIINCRIKDNVGYDALSDEIQTVYYENAASETLNPAVNNTGIIASYSNTGAGSVVPADIATTIATLGVNDGPANSKYRINIFTRVTKGASAGYTRLSVQKSSGTASVLFGVDATSIPVRIGEQGISETWGVAFSGIATKTTSGTLQIGIVALSENSQLTILSGDLQYLIERIL